MSPSPRSRRPTRVSPRAECRACADPISFVINDGTGSRIPVNPLPDEGGKIAGRVIGNNLHGYVITDAKPLRPGFLAFAAHWATCPAGKPAPKPTSPQPPTDPTLFDEETP